MGIVLISFGVYLRAEDVRAGRMQIGALSNPARIAFMQHLFSLRNPNFRIYLAAQIGSNVGAWIQITPRIG